MSGITDPTEEYFKDGLWGWINAAWHKNPPPFGPSGTVARSWSNVSLPAGNSFVVDSPVPPNTVWVITNLSMAYSGTSPTSIEFSVLLSATQIELFMLFSPVNNQWYDRQGWWVLFPGDYLSLYVSGATLNDNLYGRAAGFLIDINL